MARDKLDENRTMMGQLLEDWYIGLYSDDSHLESLPGQIMEQYLAHFLNDKMLVTNWILDNILFLLQVCYNPI